MSKLWRICAISYIFHAMDTGLDYFCFNIFEQVDLFDCKPIGFREVLLFCAVIAILTMLWSASFLSTSHRQKPIAKSLSSCKHYLLSKRSISSSRLGWGSEDNPNNPSMDSCLSEDTQAWFLIVSSRCAAVWIIVRIRSFFISSGLPVPSATVSTIHWAWLPCPVKASSTPCIVSNAIRLMSKQVLSSCWGAEYPLSCKYCTIRLLNASTKFLRPKYSAAVMWPWRTKSSSCSNSKAFCFHCMLTSYSKASSGLHAYPKVKNK